MHTWVDGWDWLWMTLTMGIWLIVLGAVIFIAVRLTQRPPKSLAPTDEGRLHLPHPSSGYSTL
jgi:heme/copper-type cytochrome/quinol oxidase subunit 2